MLTSASLLRDLESDLRKVSKRLNAYTKESSPENVHDVRTAIRRFQEKSLLLPKRVRKKNKFSKYLKFLDSFFKSTTKTRDIDIIQKILAENTIQPDNFRELQRERKIEDALSFEKARRLKSRSVKFGAKDLGEKKIRKKFSREKAKLEETITNLLPQVISDQTKYEELHSLRKASKKLRYLLELDPSKSDAIALLKKWQDHLGAVHDIDVVTSYLEKNHSIHNNYAAILENMRQIRNSRYEQFVGLFAHAEHKARPAPNTAIH